jgi:hypothetical protein
MRRDDDWNHYTYRYDPGDGQPRTAHVRFDVGCALAPTPGSHSTTLRLAVPEEQAEALVAALPALPDAAWWVGEERFAGRFVAVLQVDDADGIEALARAQASGLPLAVQRSAGWDYFEDRVCPNEHGWRRITDREQLERLSIDIASLHRVAHAFYGGASGLGRVQERLLPEGFDLVDSPDGRLVLAKQHVPAEVSEVSVPLMRLAREHRCAYDGWWLC